MLQGKDSAKPKNPPKKHGLMRNGEVVGEEGEHVDSHRSNVDDHKAHRTLHGYACSPNDILLANMHVKSIRTLFSPFCSL